MIPLEQFQLEHGQTMFSEQIALLVRLRNEVWTMWNWEHVQTEVCADLKSERRGTENISQCSQSFPGYVYREHNMNGLPVSDHPTPTQPYSFKVEHHHETTLHMDKHCE